eukprot:COSAG02_NODE_43152_length_377_cov_1.115108_1_plen_46_part_00
MLGAAQEHATALHFGHLVGARFETIGQIHARNMPPESTQQELRIT